jgi:hypothetical protein
VIAYVFLHSVKHISYMYSTIFSLILCHKCSVKCSQSRASLNSKCQVLSRHLYEFVSAFLRGADLCSTLGGSFLPSSHNSIALPPISPDFPFSPFPSLPYPSLLLDAAYTRVLHQKNFGFLHCLRQVSVHFR